MTTTIYVRLLDEGTEVFRPAMAERISDNVYVILAQDAYHPETETWEFNPGSKVEVEKRELSGNFNRAHTALVAIRLVTK